jgi:hypothetical protein
MLRERGYLSQRAARSNPGDFRRILDKAGDDTPIPGDEIPEELPR